MNPAAKVFGEDDLRLIADLVIRHDAFAICDEVYEHILFDGRTVLGKAPYHITAHGIARTFLRKPRSASRSAADRASRSSAAVARPSA